MNSSEVTVFAQPIAQSTEEAPAKQKQRRISASAVKAIITVVAIVVLIVIVSAFYYPSVLPWNW